MSAVKQEPGETSAEDEPTTTTAFAIQFRPGSSCNSCGQEFGKPDEDLDDQKHS